MKKVLLFFLGLIISLSVILILQPKTAVAQIACTSNADCTDPSFCQPNCNDSDCTPRGYCSCRNGFCVQSCDVNENVCIENGGTQCGTIICSDCNNPYTCAPCPPAPTCSNSAPNDKFRVCYFDGTNPDTGDASKFKREEDEPGIPSPVGNYGQYVINHSWGYGQVDSTGFENYVSGIWRGRLNFQQGTYQFFVDHDDGVTLDLDGYGRIIDQWNNSVGTHWSSPINLPAGYRNITLRWFEGDGNAEIKLIWNYNAPPTPTIDIKANNSDGPISIAYNTSANLTWSSTNATSCTASGAWTGAKATTNSTGQSTGSLTSSKTYTLTCCNNAAGLCSSDSVTVNVAAAPAPTVNISAASTNISYNTSTTITWSSSNAANGCSISPSGWTGTSGSQSTGNLTSSRTYTATCYNAVNQSASASVTVNIRAPTAQISADSTSIPYNTGTTIRWSSTSAASCSVSPSGWSGLSGAQATGNLTSSRTYTVTCTGAAGTSNASASVTITVGTSMDFNLSNQGTKTVFKGETTSNIFTASWVSGSSEAVNLNFTALPSNVSSVFYRGGNLASDSCTPPVSGSCNSETRFTPSSTGTSGTVTVRGNTDVPVIKSSSFNLTVWDLPSASTAATCTNSSTSYNITWGGQIAPANSWADISTDSTFATYFHKNISGTASTTAPSGFTYYNSAQLLTLNPSTTYYVRLYINGVNNATLRSFTTPAACVIPMDFSLSNQGDKTVFKGETTSNIFTANWLSGISEAVNWSVTQKPANVSSTLTPTSCTPPVSGSCTTTTTFTPSTTTGGTVIAEGRTNNNVAKASTFNLNVFDQPVVSGAPSCLAPAANPYTISWGTATPTPPTATTVDATGTVGQGSSVAIGSDSLPIISYSRPGVSVNVTKCGNASCSSGNTTTIIASGANYNSETSIAIGADGLPLVGYLINTGSSGSLTIVKCGNASCSSGNTSSVVFEVLSGSPGPDYVSIAKGTNGNPVIAYSRSSSNTRLIQCGNASCSSGNTDTSIGSGNDRPPIKAVIGTDGLPVVPFVNASDGTFHVVHCGNAGCTSGNTNTTVDSGSTNGGSTGGVAIGSDGLPIISHYDNSSLDLIVTHCGNASCSSGNTKTKVDTTGNVGSFSSIAKGADGLAIIAFYDATNKDLRVFHCSNITCTTGTATSIDATGDIGTYPYIAIGSDNLPFVSYYDATNGNMKAIKCTTAACDVSRSWADISTGSSPTPTTVDATGPGISTSSAIGSDGLPVISYIIGGTSLRVTKCGNASCSSGNITNVVSTASNIQRETSIAIGTDGLPVIIFVAESAGNGLLAVKCGNASCSSGNTTTVVFSIAGPPAPAMGSIAIGTNGNPVIAYSRSSSSTRLIQCGNTACSSGNIDTLVGTANEINARVAIGTDGFPIIAYYDAGAGSAKAVHCGNAGCTAGNITTMLDSTGTVGSVGGIAIAGGLPVISYYNSTNGDLKFIRCGNLLCSSGNTTTSVDTTGNVGNYSAVAIGTDGLPFISYYDATNGDLKTAKCSNNTCSSSAITSVDTTGNVGFYTSVAIGSDTLPFISYYDATNTDMKAIKCTTSACDGAPSWNNNYYHKDISGLSSTTAPGGFGYFDGSRPDLTLSPNTPYYVRLFINGVNNTTTNSFTTPTTTCVTATCTGSPFTVKAGDTVTWTAVPSGGSPPYAYSWSGTDLLSGTINPITKTYSSLGTKSASVSVSGSSPFTCSNTVFVNTPAFIKVEGDVHSQTGINAN